MMSFSPMWRNSELGGKAQKNVPKVAAVMREHCPRD